MTPEAQTASIEMEARHCPLCGPGATKQTRFPANFTEDDLNAAIFSARRMPDRKHFRLVECTGCGIVYSDPAATPGTLASLYRESSVNYGRQEEQIYRSYASLLDRALERLEHRGTFVEVGGGRGFMLTYGAAHGFGRQIEIEPSGDAEKKFTPASKNASFSRRVFAQGVLPASSASLICFFQMLDHVPDPLGFLVAAHTALEPGGVAVCCVHDTQALSARVLGERSPIYDIEHAYLFNPDNLTRLFQRAGFGRIETFPLVNHYAIRHWLDLAPIPGGVRSMALRMLEKLQLADMRIALNAGNFGVVAQKPR